MKLINQPFENKNVGDKLIELMKSEIFETFDFFVAFAKNSGVLQLKQAFDEFRARNGVINAYIGVDFNGTSYEALTNLFNSTDTLHVVHFEGSQTFHPKMYRLKGKNKTAFIIGSNNLTGGGLWTNIESSILIEADNQETDIIELDKALGDYTQKLNSTGHSCLAISNQEQIDDLLVNGYIAKELDIILKSNKSGIVSPNQKKLFGKGTPTTTPKKTYQSISSNVKIASGITASVLSKNNLQTFWIESRAMTGGSRNILDLSKRSLLEKGDPTGTVFDMNDKRYIRGAVEFFGLDPMDESAKKDITLNFHGVDYVGNTILYPEGEKANGTWRIQIKGVDENNKEITMEFKNLSRNDEPFLVNKILAFSRVNDSYYYLSVYEKSQLAEFVAASSIVARNGQTITAKQMGLIKND